MADNIRGTIQAIGKPRPNTFKPNSPPYQSFKVNDVWYSNGAKVPPEAGTLVEFAAEQNDKGFWNVTKAGIKVIQAQEPTNNVAAAAVSASRNSTMSKDDYWGNKEKRDLEWQNYQRTQVQPVIQQQAARNAAIEFVKLLCTPLPSEDKDGNIKMLPALKLPAAVTKREQVLFEAVKKYTQEFVQENSSEKNNKNEQLPDAETPSPAKDSESVSTDDSAWDV
jgi:hypothetical protein